MTERPPIGPDDLESWADDDLVRALRAPGTAAELADQEQFVAAYRRAGRSSVRSLPRRAAGRLGAGGTAVVVTVALTSGVAAAYTGNLPDPLQQLAHTVIAAPAPDGHAAPRTSGRPVRHGSPSAPGTSTSTGPSSSGTTGPGSTTPTDSASATDTPSGGSTAGHHRPSTKPGGGPSTSPTSSPTSPGSSPGSSGGSASAMTMSAPPHRVLLGQSAVLTGTVTDSDGAPLAAYPVVLQARGPLRWHPVAQTTSDSSGVATATTPPITRSMRFRWHAGHGINSAPWLATMVPTLSVSAEVGGASTTLTPSAQGSAPGDRVQVFRHRDGRTVLIRRARLDGAGTVQISVATPPSRTTYVVRLLPTARHAAARAQVAVVPPKPAHLTIGAASTHVTSGASTVVSGTVTSASGAVLPGHVVILQRRGALRWVPVGRATTDAAGQVSIATPAIVSTARFRLRAPNGAHSDSVRVVEMPTLAASAQRSGATVVVTVSSTGAHGGDQVVLLRRTSTGLVRLRHQPLAGDGTATFSVPGRPAATTYVVRLSATLKHGPATTTVTVARAG